MEDPEKWVQMYEYKVFKNTSYATVATSQEIGGEN